MNSSPSDQKGYTNVKEDRSEQAINTRLRELAEEARNIRRDLEQGRAPRVPRSRPSADDRPPRGQKKR